MAAMSLQTESGESDVVFVTTHYVCAPAAADDDDDDFFVPMREEEDSPAAVAAAEGRNKMAALGGGGSGWAGQIRLDHLTRQFQEMCVASTSTSAASPTAGPISVAASAVSNPHSAVIRKSVADFRHVRPGNVFSVYERDGYGFSAALNAEHCFHLTQPGRCGFKMFLRMSRGLQTRLRSLSEMDGRPLRSHGSAGGGSFRQRLSAHQARLGRPCPYYHYHASSSSSLSPSPPPPSPAAPSSPTFSGGRRFSVQTRRPAPGRYELFHPAARIPEDEEGAAAAAAADELVGRYGVVGYGGVPALCPSPPPPTPSGLRSAAAATSFAFHHHHRRRRHHLTLEEILMDGAKLPLDSPAPAGPPPSSSSSTTTTAVAAAAAVSDEVQQARDVDRVVRGLKYLAVK